MPVLAFAGEALFKAGEAMKLVTLLAALSVATSAAAQPRMERPRFEIGGSAGLITAVSRGGGSLVAAAGPRLSVNLTNRTGVDLITEAIAPTGSSGLYGVYTIQLRHMVRPGGPSRAAIFVTGGTIGLFEYERVPERRSERRDGSVVVYGGHAEAELSRPVGISGGVGIQRVVARYAAFVAELQAIVPSERVLLVRGALGMSVPIGGSYARTH